VFCARARERLGIQCCGKNKIAQQEKTKAKENKKSFAHWGAGGGTVNKI